VGRHDVRLRLPGNLTIFDIRWFSIYDTKRNYNLGHVIIPEDLNVPPALVEIFESARDTTMPNCEMLHENLRIAWSVFAPSITIELAGNLKNDNEYMSFGISGKQGSSEMIGSDVAIAYRNGFLVSIIIKVFLVNFVNFVKFYFAKFYLFQFLEHLYFHFTFRLM